MALTLHSSTGKTIIVTNEPFFYKKADILPDTTFVVGVDTAIRLINVSSLLHLWSPVEYSSLLFLAEYI